MRILCRTIYGSALQTSQLLGVPHKIVPYSTLNEKFDIQPGVLPGPNERCAAQYFVIGAGGHRHVMGADNVPYTTPIEHSPNHAALYRHMPFVLREMNNDLTIAQRAKYGLRRLESHNGRQYAAYYAKRINLENVEANMEHTTMNEGVPTTVPFIPTSADLNPTPPQLPSTGVVTTSGNYLSATAVVPINFDANDVAELKNVARIMFDNELMAVISEIGIVSGVDRVVTGPGQGNTTFNYNEIIGAQIVTHITSYYSVGFTNQGFDFKVEIGATEPLIGESDIYTAVVDEL